MTLAPCQNHHVVTIRPRRAVNSALLGMPLIFITALLFALLGNGDIAVAQDIVGRISGAVTDAQGAVVPGASVTITNEATGVSRAPVTTNGAGLYVADDLPVGTYTVTVEKAGFKKTSVAGNIVTAGGRLTVDAKLEIGTVTETVSVQAVATQPIQHRVKSQPPSQTNK